MPEAIYRLENLAKIYGTRTVCLIDYLEVNKGEILGIIGPSGAGKSTLLRLLNFLEPPTSGNIYFKGQLTNGNLPLGLRRKITTVFQVPVLLNATVWDNVSYSLKLRRQQDIKERISGILHNVRMGNLAKAQARTLSGGEAQRVALARALVIQPEVLLLDEPTVNLDPYNVAIVEDIIKANNREQGTTMVLVTHNIFQARRLAHRVLFLLQGEVIEVGKTEQIFGSPHDPRTVAFIMGEMIY